MNNITEHITDIIKQSSPEVAAEEILDLFSVIKRFKVDYDLGNEKNLKAVVWAKNKDEAFKLFFEREPEAKYVMI
jgi:hypothetical protein